MHCIRNSMADGEQRDYYDLLGISRTASARKIERGFRKTIRTVGRFSSSSCSADNVIQAYRVLNDPQKRILYDRGWSDGGDTSENAQIMLPKAQWPSSGAFRQRLSSCAFISESNIKSVKNTFQDEYSKKEELLEKTLQTTVKKMLPKAHRAEDNTASIVDDTRILINPLKCSVQNGDLSNVLIILSDRKRTSVDLALAQLVMSDFTAVGYRGYRPESSLELVKGFYYIRQFPHDPERVQAAHDCLNKASCNGFDVYKEMAETIAKLLAAELSTTGFFLVNNMFCSSRELLRFTQEDEKELIKPNPSRCANGKWSTTRTLEESAMKWKEARRPSWSDADDAYTDMDAPFERPSKNAMARANAARWLLRIMKLSNIEKAQLPLYMEMVYELGQDCVAVSYRNLSTSTKLLFARLYLAVCIEAARIGRVSRKEAGIYEAYMTNVAWYSQMSLGDVENLMRCHLFKRDDDRLLSSQALDRFRNIHGFTIDKKMNQIGLLIDHCTASKSDLLLWWNDVAEMTPMKDKFEYRLEFSMYHLDELFRQHPFQVFRHRLENMKQGPLLYTLFHTDYILKQLTCDVGVSSKPPFAMRRCSRDGIFKGLPDRVVYVLRPVTERGSAVASSARYWIHAEYIQYEETETDSEVIFLVGDVKMSLCCHELIYDAKGKLINATKGQANLRADQHFYDTFSRNHNKLCRYYPEFARLNELCKLDFIMTRLRQHELDGVHSGPITQLNKLGYAANTTLQREKCRRSEPRWVPAAMYLGDGAIHCSVRLVPALGASAAQQPNCRTLVLSQNVFDNSVARLPICREARSRDTARDRGTNGGVMMERETVCSLGEHLNREMENNTARQLVAERNGMRENVENDVYIDGRHDSCDTSDRDMDTGSSGENGMIPDGESVGGTSERDIGTPESAVKSDVYADSGSDGNTNECRDDDSDGDSVKNSENGKCPENGRIFKYKAYGAMWSCWEKLNFVAATPFSFISKEILRWLLTMVRVRHCGPNFARICYIFELRLLLIASVDGYLIATPKSDSFFVGQSAILRCRTNIIDIPVRWYCDGICSQGRPAGYSQFVLEHGNLTKKYVDHVTVNKTFPGQYDLYFKAVTQDDDGNYTCADKHGIGEKAHALLTVLTTATSARTPRRPSTTLSATTASGQVTLNPVERASSGILIAVALVLVVAGVGVIIIIVFCVRRMYCFAPTTYSSTETDSRSPINLFQICFKNHEEAHAPMPETESMTRSNNSANIGSNPADLHVNETSRMTPYSSNNTQYNKDAAQTDSAFGERTSKTSTDENTSA